MVNEAGRFLSGSEDAMCDALLLRRRPEDDSCDTPEAEEVLHRMLDLSRRRSPISLSGYQGVGCEMRLWARAAREFVPDRMWISL